MPQTPNADWLKALNISEDIYQKNVHRLGNLTLAAKPDNSSMGNKTWEYKNAILKSTSHLKINEKLLQVEKWDIDEIDKRTRELIEKINELYPYPEVNSQMIQREEIRLDSNGITARGFFSLDDGSVEIDVGSRLAHYENAENFPDVEEARQELLEEGIIAEIDGVLQFVKPYMIYSKFVNSTALSTAASLILHGSKNGWAYWTNTEGVALRDVPNLREKFG